MIPTDPLVTELVQRRITLGLSQEAVARHMGVEQATVSRWENGRRTPRLSELRRYAFVLGVDLAWTIRPPRGNR